jgi:diguanylate cyclase (GGDEF)-like protein
VAEREEPDAALPEDLLAELVASQRRLSSLPLDDLDAVLQAVVDEAHRIFGERALLSLVDGEELVCRAVVGDGVRARPWDRIRTQDSLGGLAVRTGLEQLCVDGWDDPRTDAEHNRKADVRASVVAPLVHEGRVLGVLSVLSRRAGRFTARHRDALTILAFAASQSVALAVAREGSRRTEAELADSLRWLGVARQVSGAATWELDVATGRVTWSDEVYRLAGLQPGSVEPTPELWRSMVHPDDRERVAAAWAAGLRSGESVRDEFRLRARDGVERHLHAWGRVERGADGEARRMYGATIDVTELARLHRSDSLTGLFNRTVLDERLADALAHATPEAPVALLLCDLDRFKLVNDTLGHQVGDTLLVEVARRFMTRLPAGACVARLGGDEFAVVLRAAGVEQAVDAARQLVAASRQAYGLGPRVEGVVATATVGIALADCPDRDPGEVFREADLALYQAKAAGRDRWAVFDDTMRSAVEKRVRTEDVLRTALDAERLAVVYQPIVSLSTGAVTGVEALGRVLDAELGPLSPAIFMEVAEETGLVTRLDHWVLRRAARLVSDWRPLAPDGQEVPGPTVAVNFSARTLERPDVARVVGEALERDGIPGSQLLVEITEHSLLDRGSAVRQVLQEMRRLGVRVGMDDFGTGWSAMAYLTGLQLQFMKIDRSFVVRIAEGDERADSVVQAIVDLGHAHGLTVIAEGVETERQAQRLREMGCDQAQGWWFARPVPEAQLEDTVSTWNVRAAALPWTRWGRSPSS